jgi:hypothetical protein
LYNAPRHLRCTNSSYKVCLIPACIWHPLAKNSDLTRLAFHHQAPSTSLPEDLAPYHARLILANGLFTLLECCDTGLGLFVCGIVRDEINFDKGAAKYHVDLTLCLCLVFNVVMALDVVVQAATHYTLMTSGGLVVLLPLSAFLRPILLTLRVRFVSDAARALVYTITRSGTVLLLLLLMIVLAATANVLLFNATIQDSNLDGRNLDNVSGCCC